MNQDGGRVTVVRCLGRGGFGEVYLVRVDEDADPWALKLLRHDLRQDDAEASEKRLRDEARILGILKHPAIVRTRGLVRVEHRLGLLMEYVRGLDLATLTTRWKPIPARVATEIVAQVANALEYGLRAESPETMRALGLVHRDVKAENVVITPSGQVKLLDFGIARTGEIRRHAHTSTGSVTMTLRYAAPECLMGGKASPHSDVYALGAMLFRLVGGTHLFDDLPFARQVGLCAMAAQYDPWLHTRIDGPALAPIRPLLEHMLAFHPASRPSARDVADRCAAYAALEGPTLAAWAQGMEVEIGEVTGSLVGKTLAYELLEAAPRREATLQVAFAEELAATADRARPAGLRALEATPRPAPRASTPSPSPSRAIASQAGGQWWAEMSILAFIGVFGLAWLIIVTAGLVSTVALYASWSQG